MHVRVCVCSHEVERSSPAISNGLSSVPDSISLMWPVQSWIVIF